MNKISKKASDQQKCLHYERKCKIITPCCNKLYDCRICHDENEDHIVDRFSISKMKCTSCNKIQDVAKKCIYCKEDISDYYCDICHLWDSKKHIYHCNKCGICRNGLKDEKYHCDKCNICIPINFKDSHVCVENSSHNNCPICWEYMLTSHKQITILKCGHCMHTECLNELCKNDYRCPVCKKSIGDMSECWIKMTDCMKNVKIPEEMMTWKARISCNDCGFKCISDYQIVHECTQCGGWNTYVENIIH